MSHTQYTGRPHSVAGLTDKQKEYIDSHYQTMSVAKMAMNRNIRVRLIYAYLDEKGWKTPGALKKPKEPMSSEYFVWRDFGDDVFIGKH